MKLTLDLRKDADHSDDLLASFSADINGHPCEWAMWLSKTSPEYFFFEMVLAAFERASRITPV